jgi:plastocyanin domain-containing protein
MKSIFLGMLVSVIAVGGAVVLFSRGGTPVAEVPAGANVSLVGDKQVVTISAKGGYSPRVTVAKADTLTTLKVTTHGTFDCSSALTIPSIGYRANLPPSGETLVELPPQKAGTKIQGLCSMGMYNFSIAFE